VNLRQEIRGRILDRVVKVSEHELSWAELTEDSNHFTEVLRWWTSRFDTKFCSLYLYDSHTNLMVHAHSRGMPDSLLTLLRQYSAADGHGGLSVLTRRLIQVPDLRLDALYQPWLSEFEAIGLRSAWTVPMIFEDQVVGVIHTYHPEVRTLDAEEHRLAYTFATAAATLCAPSLEVPAKPVLSALEQFRRGPILDKPPQAMRPDVLDSWIRCRTIFTDTPHSPSYPRLSQRAFLKLQEKHGNLLRAARQHLNSLFQRLEELDCAVLLADPDGWLVEVLGNPRHLHQLQKDGLWLGSNVSEGYIGNTAIGSALATRKSVYFHGFEHYFSDFAHWSSAGAPILVDEGTQLLGSFAFITLGSQLDPYVFSLVQSASIAIAHWYQLDELQQDATRVHQSLLSQLDYHVIQLDTEHHVVSQRHPIPVLEDVQQTMVRVTREGEYNHSEMYIGERTYLVDVRDLWDAGGNVKGRLGLFRDVTRIKQIEHRLRDTERLSVLTSLAAGIAHEIRNPLTTARGFLQLFAERLTTEQDKQFLDLTIAELDRIHQLVKDFMSLAKPDEPHYKETTLTAVIRNIVYFLRAEATLLGVTLTMDVPELPVSVWADENQIKQVLLNVVQNALHACTSHDAVQVQLLLTPHQVEVRITDTGCGMHKDELERIFQPFFTTKPTGTGLGMSISKHIIEEHGGTIVVESTPEVGTSVQIRLQRWPAENFI